MTRVAREVTIRGRRFSVELDEKISQRLARVRRTNTKPEALVRNELRRHGLRFRTANGDLPGSPDFANRRARWALFVHGCYWHHHLGCSRATIPKRNAAFWVAKFEDNRRRDQRAVRALRKIGFSVTVIWECSADKPERMQRQIARLSRRLDDDERP